MRSFFEGKVNDYDWQTMTKKFDQLKRPDPKKINNGVVDTDEFCVFIVKQFKSLDEKAIEGIRQVFKAVDFNRNQLLSFEEF